MKDVTRIKPNYLTLIEPSQKAKSEYAAGLAIVTAFVLIASAVTFGVVVYGFSV